MMAEQLFAHDVTRALTALYTHPDPKTKKEANAWLVDFQLKPGAWQVAYELLSPQLPEEVQFFGVQTLHTKIQREWEALPNETKHGISKDLMARLHSYCSNPSSSQQSSLNTVSARLCSCVAAVAVRMAPAQWPTLIPDIISLSSPSSLSLSLASKQVALAVLSVLPEELEAGRISQKKKMEAKKVLQDGSKLVLELIRHILRPSAPVYPVLPSPTSLPSSPSSSLSLFSETSSPLASPMLSPTGPPNYTQLDSLSASLHVSALKCLRAWVEWGVPITELLADGGALLGATFDALSSNELLSYAADVLTELFTPPRQLTSGLVVSSSRLCFDQAIFVEVVRAAIARVLSCVALYKDALINKKTEVCVALSRVASAIGCGNPSTVLSTEEGIELIHFILSCSSHTDKTVVMPTLEFWEMIASLISSDGLNQLNQLNQRNIVGTITQSLSSLLPILVHQCKFSHDVSPDNVSETTRRSYESAERKSEEHEVVDFRIAAIDSFLGVFRAISATKYLQILAETLSPAPPASLTWQTLEACVYATKVVSDENSSVLSSNANSLHLSAQLAEGVADVLAPGVKQQNIPAILAFSFAGLVKSLPHEVWQHAALTNKTITILISLLSFPIRISSLFLENVAHALVELTDPSLLPRTAAIFSPHLSTIAGACVSNYLPPEIRDFISAAFLSIVQITLSPEQATQAITDMVAAVAARIVQHTNTTHTVSHEATLEVIADVQIMDSLVGSKIVLNNQLVDHILQVLETIAHRSYTKEGESVIDALSRLCTSLLTLTTHQSHPRCVSILVSVFVHTRRASPLRALAYAISPKGKNPPPPPLIAPGGAFESVLTQIASFAVSNITAISVETIGAFYWTMTCAAQISPPLPSLSSTLLPSAQAAITNLPRMIDDPLAATYGLAFLALVPTHSLFSSFSLSLCDPLLHLIFTILPQVQERGLIRPLADLLHSLLNHPQFSQQAKNTTHMCIMTSAAFSRFNEEERKRLARIVLGITPKPRFRAMFTDFFNIASGESDLDVLLAYEL